MESRNKGFPDTHGSLALVDTIKDGGVSNMESRDKGFPDSQGLFETALRPLEPKMRKRQKQIK